MNCTEHGFGVTSILGNRVIRAMIACMILKKYNSNITSESGRSSSLVEIMLVLAQYSKFGFFGS